MSDSKKLRMVPVDMPLPGDIATHVDGRLDSREVAKVSEDGESIWLSFIGPDTFGPYPADNYTYKRREWV